MEEMLGARIHGHVSLRKLTLCCAGYIEKVVENEKGIYKVSSGVLQKKNVCYCNSQDLVTLTCILPLKRRLTFYISVDDSRVNKLFLCSVGLSQKMGFR